MNCKVCGNVVSNFDRVCSVCGNDLGTQRRETAQTAYSSARSSSYPPNTQQNRASSLVHEKEEAINRILFDSEGVSAKERLEERRKKRQVEKTTSQTGFPSIFSQDRKEAKRAQRADFGPDTEQDAEDPFTTEQKPLRKFSSEFVFSESPKQEAYVAFEQEIRGLTLQEILEQQGGRGPTQQEILEQQGRGPAQQEILEQQGGRGPVQQEVRGPEQQGSRSPMQQAFAVPPVSAETYEPIGYNPTPAERPLEAPPYADSYFAFAPTEEEQAKFEVDKKNEEFQELLDQEFSRLKNRDAGETAQFDPSGAAGKSYIQERVDSYLKNSDLDMPPPGRYNGGNHQAIPTAPVAPQTAYDAAHENHKDVRTTAYNAGHAGDAFPDFDYGRKYQQVEAEPLDFAVPEAAQEESFSLDDLEKFDFSGSLQEPAIPADPFADPTFSIPDFAVSAQEPAIPAIPADPFADPAFSIPDFAVPTPETEISGEGSFAIPTPETDFTMPYPSETEFQTEFRPGPYMESGVANGAAGAMNPAGAADLTDTEMNPRSVYWGNSRNEAPTRESIAAFLDKPVDFPFDYKNPSRAFDFGQQGQKSPETAGRYFDDDGISSVNTDEPPRFYKEYTQGIMIEAVDAANTARRAESGSPAGRAESVSPSGRAETGSPAGRAEMAYTARQAREVEPADTIPDFLTAYDEEQLGKPMSIPVPVKNNRPAKADPEDSEDKESAKERKKANAKRSALSAIITILIVVLVVFVACIVVLKLTPDSIGARYIQDLIETIQSKFG